MYGKNTTPIKKYKDQCLLHMIQNGMWDIFYIPYPRNAAKYWYLFTNQSTFPMCYINKYTEDLIHYFKREDKYTLQNPNWSGKYLKSALASDILTKVLTTNTFNSYGT